MACFEGDGPALYDLRLFVAGSSANSVRALMNLRRICDEHLDGQYSLEVVDLYQQPGLAKAEQIIAAPTLVKKLPRPPRKIVGDLSNKSKVLAGIGYVEGAA